MYPKLCSILYLESAIARPIRSQEIWSRDQKFVTSPVIGQLHFLEDPSTIILSKFSCKLLQYLYYDIICLSLLSELLQSSSKILLKYCIHNLPKFTK